MQPNRDAGLQRLETFLPSAGSHYQQQRNYDFGPDDRRNVSMLSPWLRRRVLLEREVLQAVVQRHGRSDAGKFIDEVFWRAYFRGWMAQRSSLWSDYSNSVQHQAQALSSDAELASRLRNAEQGRTGNPAFDAWARELIETGYLHNHARMWFASIWVFTLRLPWALGADFFLRHLLDGDPASNTLSWRWVSGLHTRGKTYLARRNNILKFTDGRLDPGPDLAEEAFIPEDCCPPAQPCLRWPEVPREPGDGSAWLLTDEDATPPVSLPSGVPLVALQATGSLSVDGPSARVEAFVEGCLNDALQRFGGERGVFDGWGEPENFLARLKALGVRDLHCFHVPYGPAADVLVHLETQLSGESIRLHRHVRPYDRAAWPWAERGFFKLKRHIPELLDQLDTAGCSDA